MSTYACATLCVVIAFPCIGQSSDNDDLLETVRISHRSARQAIRQFSCNYLMRETLPSNKVIASGKYARSANIVSIKDGNEGLSTLDMLIRNGECKTVGRAWKNGKVEYFAGRESEVDFFAWGDVWQRMLIDHADQEGGRCNCDMVLDRIGKAARLSRDRVSGRDCVRIEVEEKTKLGHTKVLRIWHDIGSNYLIRKREAYDLSDPKDRTAAEVTEFLEAAPGILIPIKCRLDVFRAGQLAKSYETTLSDLQVNLPISDSTFALPPIPRGTRLRDSLQGTEGTIGPDWKPVGPTTPIKKVIASPGSSDVIGGTPTQAESWTLNQYLLYGSVLVFVTCVSILLLRRRRASSEMDALPK